MTWISNLQLETKRDFRETFENNKRSWEDKESHLREDIHLGEALPQECLKDQF